MVPTQEKQAHQILSIFRAHRLHLRPFETRTKGPVCVNTTCRLSLCQSPLVQERCLSATLWIGLILFSHLLPGGTEAGISLLSLSGLPQLCVGASTVTNITSWHLSGTMTWEMSQFDLNGLGFKSLASKTELQIKSLHSSWSNKVEKKNLNKAQQQNVYHRKKYETRI